MRRLKVAAQWSYWAGQELDGVYTMALSPDGTRLATVHHSGRFSVWQVPSLKLSKTWLLHEQVRVLFLVCKQTWLLQVRAVFGLLWC